jgi:hypothetical protein
MEGNSKNRSGCIWYGLDPRLCFFCFFGAACDPQVDSSIFPTTQFDFNVITTYIDIFNTGEIYVGKNVVTSQPVAIKVERADTKKQVLKLEVAVLKKIQRMRTFDIAKNPEFRRNAKVVYYLSLRSFSFPVCLSFHYVR